MGSKNTAVVGKGEGEGGGGAWRMAAAMGLSGTIGLFVVASGQSTLTVVWFRCLIGAVALLAWLAWQGAWRPLGGKAWGWLLLGAVALIANWLFLFSAYRLSGIAVSTVVYHVQPFFLIVLAALVQREAPDWHKIPWLLVALSGVALTSGLRFGGSQTQLLSGTALALGAALLYAVATLATRKLTGIAPAQIAGLQLLLGAALLLPWVRFSAEAFGWKAWAALLTLGLVHTGLMYNLMYAAFQRLPAGRIAILSFIYPLVAIVVDLLVFDLALSALQVGGMVLILLAVVAHQRGWHFPPLAARQPAAGA